MSESLSLLDLIPAASPIWILQTARLEEDTWQYVEMQLAHLLYPRQAWVRTIEERLNGDDRFEFALTFWNDSPGPGWREIARTRRAVLHQATDP